jgi:leucyl/phenylalanyl-tRNA--protein transferase
MNRMPTEPPSTGWVFPDVSVPPEAGGPDDLVGAGADLEPGTLLAAYRRGLFPMPGSPGGRAMLWWSPVERGVLPLDGLRVSRSLRASARRMEVRVDTAFDEVVAACADPRRDGAWIDSGIVEAYTRLHALGCSTGCGTPPRWRSSRWWTCSATSTPTAGSSTCSGPPSTSPRSAS